MKSVCAFCLEDRLLWIQPIPGCQFGVSDEEIIEFDGKHWCPYHLPIRSVSGELSPKAQWGQDQIKKFDDGINHIIEHTPRDSRFATDLCGVVFPHKVSFIAYSDKRPMQGVSFEACEFSRGADFAGVSFSGNTVFRKAKFLDKSNFKNAIFEGDANFEAAEFRDIEFDSAKVIGCANFHNATFTGNDFSFYEAEFRSDVVFAKAVFNEGLADYSRARFTSGKRISFNGTCFGKNVTFGHAIFEGIADFSETVFRGTSAFIGATFSDARFTNAAFCGSVNFNRARFSSYVDFSSEKPFVQDVISEQYASDCFPVCDFSDVEFLGVARFVNRKFLNTANFQGGCFQVAPEFYGCTLHQGTSFAKRDFRDYSGSETTFGSAMLAYRTLKVGMESVRDRNEETRFFALEQKSMRKAKEGSLPDRLFSFLYEMVSDYGRSISRSVMYLAVSYLTFFGIYFFLIPTCASANLLRVSLEPVFQPFKPFGPAGHNYSLALSLVMAFHSLITLSLVAIFLLALRRRFKLD